MSSDLVLVHRDAALLAQAAAARLLTAVADAQAARGTAHLVLTGGRNGNALLAALAAHPARDAVDWAHVELWWGDERYLPAGDPERNAVQAAAFLDAVRPLGARVHEMPPADGAPAEQAAARYAAELAAAAAPGEALPLFDVLLLGVGPDAHVASLFPGHPGTEQADGTVIAVHDSPKPPPTRLSLTLPALHHARQVWLLAAGQDKADAVALARTSPGAATAPAGAVTGTERTLWLLDDAAAGKTA
ncbi:MULTISPECIES: 6-phosphogluconolactonase [Kitasatospora]|uniref:6-phosphogluconolactonase n=1 Tax=Kitasatospora setae (strain ATCC 33774 / DSM 43861 / JCM 3304 / KCC A-0304 / NBRC 14216 / KM-6054) TaxID=452652 RepID=E4MZZ2_KITSK|nr:6-phosphogluconolactonase [Kitasatospora setae]BAJ31320.1 putative 6-phosphogluconolactonase [Kitasatospora setae KM-6054]